MNKRIFTFFLLACFSLNGLAQTSIQSAEITFVFVSKKVEGSISGFKSTSIIDLENLSNSRFSGSVTVETLKTGNFLRDWSLKSGKYFNADDHPVITFHGSSVSATDIGFTVMGMLTIKGKENPITIDFTQKENKLLGTATLFSSDFGIDIKKKREDNKVEVRLEFLLE
ncbi:MAG: YceI family protein [Bacteroidota bacterium]